MLFEELDRLGVELTVGLEDTEIALERYDSDIFTLNTLLESVVSQGASRDVMVSLEELIVDSLPNRYPAASFTEVPSTTNLTIAVESIIGSIVKTASNIITTIVKAILNLITTIGKFIGSLFGITTKVNDKSVAVVKLRDTTDNVVDDMDKVQRKEFDTKVAEQELLAKLSLRRLPVTDNLLKDAKRINTIFSSTISSLHETATNVKERLESTSKFRGDTILASKRTETLRDVVANTKLPPIYDLENFEPIFKFYDVKVSSRPPASAHPSILLGIREGSWRTLKKVSVELLKPDTKTRESSKYGQDMVDITKEPLGIEDDYIGSLNTILDFLTAGLTKLSAGDSFVPDSSIVDREYAQAYQATVNITKMQITTIRSDLFNFAASIAVVGNLLKGIVNLANSVELYEKERAKIAEDVVK